MEIFKNYIIISHGTRFINSNYDDSHFQVPDGFNIITITQPNQTLWPKTIKIFITEMTHPLRKQYYQNKLNNIIEERNLPKRAKKCRRLEREIIINYIEDKIKQDKTLYKPLKVDKENKNQFERFLSDIGINQPYTDRIVDIQTLRSELLRQLDTVKNDLVFQIRIYTRQSPAPIMAVDIDDTNTEIYQGIYELNSLNYDMLIKESTENSSMFNFKNTNDLNDEYSDEYNVFSQLKQNGIDNGNLFIISCGTYDIEDKENLKSRIKLIRQQSLRNQGRIKRKYFIHYD
jgi:hypothetical protein